MAHPIAGDAGPTTVQTRLWVQEHDCLYRVLKSRNNTSPKFRFPDLMGACVSLVAGHSQGHQLLVDFLANELSQRDPTAQMRSCDIWPAQFDQLMSVRGAAWNRFPNPMFELEHIASACVAVAMQAPFGEAPVLLEARRNFVARSCAARSQAS